MTTHSRYTPSLVSFSFLATVSPGRQALLAAALATCLVGCQRVEADPAKAEIPAVQVTSVAPSLASYEREYVGRVQAVRYTEVRSRVKGVIDAASVDEGAAVKADQVLFSISAKELQQELNKAKAASAAAAADLKLERLERDNTGMLFEKSVVSGAEMALADSRVGVLAAKLEQAKADEKQATINLTYTKVRAPFDGVVNRIPNKPGSTVGEDTLLTTIADAREVFVYFHMSEVEYLQYSSATPVEPAKRVTLRLADGSVHAHEGVVDTVGSEFNDATGTIALRARFPNPDGTLKHGSSGKVVIRTEIPEAIVVAQKSTFEIQGRLYVYVVDAEGMARSREILPQARLQDTFVVSDGLEPEDRFVVEGVQKLKDGTRVRVKPTT